jgi:RNA ligase (TIGR02306 family)
MSKFTVPVLTLDSIEPHPNADRLDLAVVGGYRSIVGKGNLHPGDPIVYIPTDAVIPPETALGLGIDKYLTGSKKDRVKAVKLRGVLSEGICLPISIVNGFLWKNEALRAQTVGGNFTPENPVWWTEGQDIAELLNITKYEEVIPAQFIGKIRPWPDFIPKYDIENIKRPEHRSILQEGEQVVITEKLHGTNIAVGHKWEEDEVGVIHTSVVCSRNQSVLPTDPDGSIPGNEGNLYWRAAKKFGLLEKLDDLVELYRLGTGAPPRTISLHGEVVGVQDLAYGCQKDDPGFYAFDLRVDGKYVDAADFAAICERVGIPTVPVLYQGPFEYAALDALAEGPTVAGDCHIREGVVVKPYEEREDYTLGRVVLKYVSGSYLTRAGGTELQ